MSIKPELQRCVADYLRKYLVNHGEWEDVPEKGRAAPGIDHIWKIGLTEFQIEDIADDIIEEIKRTLGKHIFTSVFGEEVEND